MSVSIKRLSGQLLVVGGAAVFALAAVNPPATQATPATSQVQVVNTPAQPVPTAAQGTSAVRVPLLPTSR